MHTKRFRLSILFFCLFLAFITLPYGRSSFILNFIEPYIRSAFLNNYVYVNIDSILIYNLLKSLVGLFLSIVSSLFFVIAIASYIIHLVLKKPKKIIFIIGLILSIALLIINPLISISTNSYIVIDYLFEIIVRLSNIFIPSIIAYIDYIIRVIISLPQISFLLFFIFVIFVTWTSEIKKGFKIVITVSSSIIFLTQFVLYILNLIFGFSHILFAIFESISLDLYIELIQITEMIYTPLSYAQAFFGKLLAFGCILGILVAIFSNSYFQEKKFIPLYISPFIVTTLISIITILSKGIYIIFMFIITYIH